MYSYSTSANPYEEENRILKETINRLKEEIERYKSTPLMVCEVRETFGSNVLIRIPNGNQFLVNISSECEKLRAGDMVLVEQKNLTIIKKMPITRRFNVEKFVIVEKPANTGNQGSR
jgi:ATP-dependent 26S proteasome regulatory subunit